MHERSDLVGRRLAAHLHDLCSIADSNERRRRAQQVLDKLSPAEESVLFGTSGQQRCKWEGFGGNNFVSPRSHARISRLEQMKRAMMEDPVFGARNDRTGAGDINRGHLLDMTQV